MRGWDRFVLIVGGCLWPGVAAGAELVLQERYPLIGGEVQLRVTAPRPLAALPIDRDGANVQTAETPRYTLYADLDKIDYDDRGGFFRYHLYAEPRAGVEEGIFGYTAKGRPAGSFPPQLADVPFTLGDPPQNGTISLPLFSLDEPRYLASPSWADPQEVDLTNGARIGVPLENLLRLPVKIEELRQHSPGRLWQRTTLAQVGVPTFRPFRLAPGAKSADQLVLELEPGPRAIVKALFPGAGRREQDTVQASLVASLPWDGLPRQTVSVAVPVRFVPWPPILFVAVAVGTVLGWLVSWVPHRRRRADKWRALGVSLLVAILVEIVAMVLVQLDSEFRLLGLELDPFQLLPAALIGVAMGLLGYKSVKVLQGFFPQGGRAE